MDYKISNINNTDINKNINDTVKQISTKNEENQNLNTKQSLLMNTLNKFYNHEQNIELISSVLQGNTKLSLRIIDWFVTNYSKKKKYSL